MSLYFTVSIKVTRRLRKDVTSKLEEVSANTHSFTVSEETRVSLTCDLTTLINNRGVGCFEEVASEGHISY